MGNPQPVRYFPSDAEVTAWIAADLAGDGTTDVAADDQRTAAAADSAGHFVDTARRDVADGHIDLVVIDHGGSADRPYGEHVLHAGITTYWAVSHLVSDACVHAGETRPLIIIADPPTACCRDCWPILGTEISARPVLWPGSCDRCGATTVRPIRSKLLFAHIELRSKICGSCLAQEMAAAKDIPRNRPCPCGSGKKFKRCCGPS